jgi:hypothetical protein
MSATTNSPNAGSSWLPSLFTKRPTAVRQPLLYPTKGRAPTYESEDFIYAKKDVEDITLRLFYNVLTHKYAPRTSRNGALVQRDASESMLLASRDIDNANRQIGRILHFMSGDTGLIDWNIATRLIEHAIWALIEMVSRPKNETPRTKAWNDNCAAYVMSALLFPLKRGMSDPDGESMLYKTVRYTKYAFGPKVMAAIASRNDQRFRESELDDKTVIKAFERRYKTKVGTEWTAFI